jgi:hypothetical protein
MSSGPTDEEASIQFYRVDFCGYYDKRPLVFRFGGLEEIIPQLKKWAIDQNPPIQQTKTYPPDTHNRYLESYCLAVHAAAAGDFFITLWIRTEADDENMLASIKGDSVVSAPSITRSVLGKTDLPGLPAYFWFLPKERLMGVVRFGKHKLLHTPDICRYLKGYLEIWIKELRQTKRGSDFKLSLAPELNMSLQDLTVKFETSRVKHEGNQAKIRAKRLGIKRIIRKRELNYVRPDERSRWRNLRNWFGLGRELEVVEQPREIRCRVELDCPIPLSEEELDAIFMDFEKDSNLWSDVGFSMTDSVDEKYVEWLSHSYSKETVNLAVTRKDGIVELAALAKSVAEHRAKLIAKCVVDSQSAKLAKVKPVRRRRANATANE